jgi:phosphatidylglycerophosphatase A
MRLGRRDVAWAIATWFGCGFVPVAPGTAGSLGALPLYLLVSGHGPGAVLLAAALVGLTGVWAAATVARELACEDPQVVVVDEVAGMLVTVSPLSQPSWRAMVLAIVLFRLLDSIKPWPVGRLEALPGGWGIVLDDVAAGLLGACVMALLQAAKLI